MPVRRISMLMAAAVAVALAPAVVADAASISPDDPSCQVQEYGSPGIISYTAHFSANPCGRPVRAVVWCNDEFTTGASEHYGGTITGTGWSKYSCDITQNMVDWGWQEYVPNPYGPGGSWTTYGQGD